jgi:hypothetical protein
VGNAPFQGRWRCFDFSHKLKAKSDSLLRKSAWQQNALIDCVHLRATAKCHGQVEFVVNNLQSFFDTWLTHRA